MKVRNCVVCSKEMEVPPRSGRKYCEVCVKERNKQKAKDHYNKCIADGRITAYRIRMKEAQRERLKNDAYRLITRVKYRAHCKGVECTISPEDLVIPEKCPVLNTNFVPNTEYAMSIDAIDPKIGYIPGNVQIISMKANAMKNSASKEELQLFAKWVMSL